MMRNYTIFQIKQEYQPFIIGREHLLYELLDGTESDHTQSYSQMSYLCEPIDHQRIEQAVFNKMSNLFPSIIKKKEAYELDHPIKGQIKIEVSPMHIKAFCEGSRMLDLDLFVSLSNVSGYFFALLEEEKECGWLKPVKTEQLSMNYMQEARFI